MCFFTVLFAMPAVEQSKQGSCYYEWSSKLCAMVKPWRYYQLVVPFVVEAGSMWLQMPIVPTVLCTWDSHYVALPDIPLASVQPLT